MVRRHGWQLPAHTFQVVAITVYFLLATAFYVFLAPFLWIDGLESAAFALYSPLFITVLLLYVRCSAINPADPGVLKNRPLSKHDENSSFSHISGDMTPVTSSPLSALQQSERGFDRKFSQVRVGWSQAPGVCSFTGLCMLCCGWLVQDDVCYNQAKYEQPVPEEDILFCTLCNAEVRKYSKHCRSCDKCVDGFDHHCRWLNNCVGRKNYSTFIALMALSLVLLVVEWVTGAAVFIRCFVDRRGTLDQIYSKLGNGFSMAPFASIVLLCTLVAFLASVPLGELFFFHLILMRKGISTYEYVVAMRAQAEAQVDSPAPAEEESELSSPGASTAGLSGGSSFGIQVRGGGSWCTPPRIFIEHQELRDLSPCKAYGRKRKMGTIVEETTPAEESPERNVDESGTVEEETVANDPNNQSETEPSCSRDEDLDMASGRVLSTIDPDAAGRPRKKVPGNVRISAWRLSKLNAEEASRAAAKARDRSSVLQKLGDRDPGNGREVEYSSSSNVSSQSGVSLDYVLQQRPLERASQQKVLTPRGLPSLNPELSRSHVARVPVLVGRSSESAYVDSDVRSSFSSHSITSTISETTLSPLPAESRYGSSENHVSDAVAAAAGGLRGAPVEAQSSASSTTVAPSPGARMSGSAFHGRAPAAAWRAHVPPWGAGVMSSTESGVAPTARPRNVISRDHRRSAVFWNRPGLGRFGGDPGVVIGRPQSRISFSGSAISTSTFPSQVIRTWHKNPLSAHPPDVSESELGTAAGTSASSSSTPTEVLGPSPVLPSQANPPESFSIFFGPPIVPLGAAKVQPPPSKPPAADSRDGVHIQIAAQSSKPVAPVTLRSSTPRSESPTFRSSQSKH